MEDVIRDDCIHVAEVQWQHLAPGGWYNSAGIEGKALAKIYDTMS